MASSERCESSMRLLVANIIHSATGCLLDKYEKAIRGIAREEGAIRGIAMLGDQGHGLGGKLDETNRHRWGQAS